MSGEAHALYQIGRLNAAFLFLLLSGCAQEQSESDRRSTMHTVLMTCCRAAYLPQSIDAAPGDTLRFINSDSSEHDVKFERSHMPESVVAQLAANMAGGEDTLQSPVVNPKERYLIPLTGIPIGDYEAFCTFHVWMRLHVRVRARQP
jgi:plastocyanin